MSKNIAIIFAGGSGARMGSGLPKQFIEVDGKPIIIHTLEVFEDDEDIDSIYIACKREYMDRLDKMVKRYLISKVRKIVPGGKTGQDSIFNALSAAYEDNGDDDVVLIHDGVRPCISSETIRKDLDCVEKYGNAVTCTALNETPVISNDGITVGDLPKRGSLFTAQAPQCFRLGEVMEAHEKVRKENPSYEGIIDTCTLMKTVGHKVAIVPGPRGNIKVTTPEDLFLLRAMIQYQETAHVFGFAAKEVDPKLKK